MRSPRRFPDEHGAAAVELALVLPILVVLLFGTVQFALAYHTLSTLSHAAREGVRTLALTGNASAAESATRSAITTLRADQLSLVQVVPGPCQPAQPGQPATLTASYPFHVDVPLLPSATITLTGKGVMRCGG